MKYLALLITFNICAFKLGVENITAEQFAYLTQKRVALVANQTSVDQQGKHTAEKFLERGIALSYIITPEHGIEEALFKNKMHYHTLRSIPERKLFHHDELVALKPSTFQNIDVLVFDVQDVGMRYFTHGASLYYLMQASIEYGFELWILDRPNPMGAIIEGLCPDSSKSRFVYGAVPLRHGLTMGELAAYLHTYFLSKKTNVTVVNMEHYRREPSLDLLQLPVSPGLRSVESSLCYSLTGFLGEIRPFATGLRSDYSYQFVALHSRRNIKDEIWKPVARTLNRYGVQSKLSSYEDRKTKHQWRGLQMHIPDPQKLTLMPLYIKLLDYFKKHNIEISYSDLFKSLCANKYFLDYMDNKLSYEKLIIKVNSDLKHYYTRAQKIFLYKPLPRVIFLS